jgi:hypothetical protein
VEHSTCRPFLEVLPVARDDWPLSLYPFLSDWRIEMRRGRFHGLRFQRRIRRLPGVHLNVSLSGVGVSVGGRGFHAGVTGRGQRYVSAGLRGTGLSVRQYSPMNSTPKLSFWPVAIAAAVLVVLLALAAR